MANTPAADLGDAIAKLGFRPGRAGPGEPSPAYSSVERAEAMRLLAHADPDNLIQAIKGFAERDNIGPIADALIRLSNIRIKLGEFGEWPPFGES